MADNNRFGLSNLRDGVKNRADELKHKDNVDARSFDEPRPSEDEGPFKPFTFQQEDFDRTEPDKDALRKYWRQYETTPFIRRSISSFALQVMEPGYYLQARDIDQEDLINIDHWLSESAVINGRPGKDFRQLAKEMVVQMEVRGTAFAEVAPDKNDDDKIAGFKLINAETMEAVTRPGQSILLAPDDVNEYEDAPAAESGGAAAWMQDLGETETFFGTPVSGKNRGMDDNDVDDDFKVGFQRDEIVAIPRDADAGEVFGTSRIEAVSDRVKGLKNKLSDNDDAIASKAYPLWLFMFGAEDNPWEAEDINEFMRSHEMENFHAGMKQGVRGDVSVETVSGEVAEIAESLQFDIEYIMSIMPIPKAMLGVFQEEAVGQAGAMFQQQEVQRQIKATRRDLEDEFTPVIREVAKQMGVDEEAAESLRLKVGDPNGVETETTPRENIIRYVPQDQREPQESQPDETQKSPGNDGVGPSDEERRDNGEIVADVPEDPTDVPAQAGAQSWHTGAGIAELSLDDNESLADEIFDALQNTREQTLNEVGRRYSDKPHHAVANFPNVANSVMSEQLRRGRFTDDVEPIVEDSLSDGNRTQVSNNVRFFVQNVENATEDALEEMARLMQIQVRRGVEQGDDWSTVRSRVEGEYDDANLRQRAELISHMELKNATENMKLQQFERDPDVVGVRVVNENPSTPLTQSLSGVEAYFDDGDIQSQLAAQTRDEFLHSGFDPLPATPPFHFNDSTRLEPIKQDD
jgi:hypothetical protein